MGQMVVELEIVVDDGVICMIELEEMFECPSSLLVLYLDIVDRDWVEVYCVPGVASEEAG
jgi:hypothetical protein